jgi:hypothetical protein
MTFYIADFLNYLTLIQTNMKSRSLLLSASILATFTAALHTIGGTMEIYDPLFNSVMPESVKLVLYACWHMVSVALILSAFALYRLARKSHETMNVDLAGFMGVFWILCGFVFVAIDLSFLGWAGLWELPQWILLIPIGALSWYGAWRFQLEAGNNPRNRS